MLAQDRDAVLPQAISTILRSYFDNESSLWHGSPLALKCRKQRRRIFPQIPELREHQKIELFAIVGNKSSDVFAVVV